ncbi:hypothetical protein RCL1_006075 [Eukaryota sp. TZLM3-RCL]
MSDEILTPRTLRLATIGHSFSKGVIRDESLSVPFSCANSRSKVASSPISPYVSCMTFANNYVWCGYKDNTIRIVDPSTGLPHRSIPTGKYSPSCMAIVVYNNIERVWVGSTGTPVLIYDPITFELIKTINLKQNTKAVVVHDSAAHGVFIVTSDSKLVLYNRITMSLIKTFITGLTQSKDLVTVGDFIWLACSSSLEAFVMSNSKLNKVYSDTLSVKGGPNVLTMFFHDSNVSLLLVGTLDGCLRVYDPKLHTRLAVLKGHSLPITAISCRGNTVWTGDSDGVLLAWDFSDLNKINTATDQGLLKERLSVHNGRITSICLINDQVWSSSVDQSISTWISDPYSPCTPLQTPHRHSRSTSKLAQSTLSKDEEGLFEEEEEDEISGEKGEDVYSTHSIPPYDPPPTPELDIASFYTPKVLRPLRFDVEEVKPISDNSELINKLNNENKSLKNQIESQSAEVKRLSSELSKTMQLNSEIKKLRTKECEQELLIFDLNSKSELQDKHLKEVLENNELLTKTVVNLTSEKDRLSHDYSVLKSTTMNFKNKILTQLSLSPDSNAKLILNSISQLQESFESIKLITNEIVSILGLAPDSLDSVPSTLAKILSENSYLSGQVLDLNTKLRANNSVRSTLESQLTDVKQELDEKKLEISFINLEKKDLNAEIADLKLKIEEFLVREDNLRTENQNLESNISEFVLQKYESESRISDLSKLIDASNQKIEQLQSTIETVEFSFKEKSEEVMKLLAELSNNKKSFELISAALDISSIKSDVIVNSINDLKVKIRDQISQLKVQVDSNCRLQADLDSLSHDLSTSSNKCQEYLSIISDLEKEHKSTRKQVSELFEIRSQLLSELEKLKSENIDLSTNTKEKDQRLRRQLQISQTHLSATREELENLRKTFNDQTAELTSKLENDQVQIAELTSKLENDQVQIAELTSKLENEQNNVAELTSKLENDQVQIAELTSKLENDQVQIAELTSKLENEQNNVAELTSKLENDQVQIAELTSKLENDQVQIAELTSKLENEHNNVAELTSKLEDEQNNVAELTSKLENDQVQIAELTSKLENDQVQIAELTSKLEDDRVQIAELTSKLEDDRVQIAELTSKLEDDRVQIAELTSKLEDDRVQIAELTSKLENEQNNVAELTSKLENEHNNVAELTSKLEDEQNNVAELTSKLENDQVQIAELTSKLENEQNNVAELTSKLENEQNNVAELTSKLENEQNNVAELTSKLEDEQNNVAELTSKLENEQNNVAELTSKLENEQNMISSLISTVDLPGAHRCLDSSLNSIKICNENLTQMPFTYHSTPISKISELTDQLQLIINQFNDCSSSLKFYQKLCIDLESRVGQQKSSIFDLSCSLQESQANSSEKISELQEHIKSLENSLDHVSELLKTKINQNDLLTHSLEENQSKIRQVVSNFELQSNLIKKELTTCQGFNYSLINQNQNLSVEVSRLSLELFRVSRNSEILTENLDKNIREFDNLSIEFENLQSKYQNSLIKIQEVSTIKNSLLLDVDYYKNLSLDLEEKVLTLKNSCENLTNGFNDEVSALKLKNSDEISRLSCSINDLKRENSELYATISSFSNEIFGGNISSTVDCDVKNSNQSTPISKIPELTDQLQLIINQFNDCSSSLKFYQKLCIDLESRVGQQKSSIFDLSCSLQESQANSSEKISELQEHIKSLENSLDHVSELLKTKINQNDLLTHSLEENQSKIRQVVSNFELQSNLIKKELTTCQGFNYSLINQNQNLSVEVSRLSLELFRVSRNSEILTENLDKNIREFDNLSIEFENLQSKYQNSLIKIQEISTIKNSLLLDVDYYKNLSLDLEEKVLTLKHSYEILTNSYNDEVSALKLKNSDEISRLACSINDLKRENSELYATISSFSNEIFGGNISSTVDCDVKNSNQSTPISKIPELTDQLQLIINQFNDCSSSLKFYQKLCIDLESRVGQQKSSIFDLSCSLQESQANSSEKISELQEHIKSLENSLDHVSELLKTKINQNDLLTHSLEENQSKIRQLVSNFELQSNLIKKELTTCQGFNYSLINQNQNLSVEVSRLSLELFRVSRNSEILTENLDKNIREFDNLSIEFENLQSKYQNSLIKIQEISTIKNSLLLDVDYYKNLSLDLEEKVLTLKNSYEILTNSYNDEVSALKLKNSDEISRLACSINDLKRENSELYATISSFSNEIFGGNISSTVDCDVKNSNQSTPISKIPELTDQLQLIINQFNDCSSSLKFYQKLCIDLESRVGQQKSSIFDLSCSLQESQANSSEKISELQEHIKSLENSLDHVSELLKTKINQNDLLTHSLEENQSKIRQLVSNFELQSNLIKKELTTCQGFNYSLINQNQNLSVEVSRLSLELFRVSRNSEILTENLDKNIREFDNLSIEFENLQSKYQNSLIKIQEISTIKNSLLLDVDYYKNLSLDLEEKVLTLKNSYEILTNSYNDEVSALKLKNSDEISRLACSINDLKRENSELYATISSFSNEIFGGNISSTVDCDVKNSNQSTPISKIPELTDQLQLIINQFNDCSSSLKFYQKLCIDLESRVGQQKSSIFDLSCSLQESQANSSEKNF